MIEHHHEGGQIFALGAETISDPRAHAGTPGLDEAAVHLEQGGAVIVALGVHGTDHAEGIRVSRELGKCLRHVDAGLPVSGKGIGTGHGDIPGLRAHKRVLLLPNGNRPAMPFGKLGLGVKQIDVARPAIHEQEDH